MPLVPRPSPTLLAALLALAAFAAGAEDPLAGEVDVQVLQPYATVSGARRTEAEVYALFVNVETTDRLAGAESPDCGRVELVSADGQPLPFSDFGFTEDVETRLAPGTLHLKLVGLKKPLVAGERVLVTLHLAEGGRLALEATVR